MLRRQVHTWHPLGIWGGAKQTPCTHDAKARRLQLRAADDGLPKFFKTANGVRVQELLVGSGQQVQPGDAVLVDFVLRRANGYFIYGELQCSTSRGALPLGVCFTCQNPAGCLSHWH